MALSASLTNDVAVPVSRSPRTPVEIKVYEAKDWPQIAPIWSELDRTSPYSSFYLSLHWTSAWLEIFGALLQPEILVFKAEDSPVGVCLLVRANERRGPFRVKQIYLNTGGGDPADRTLMEFNNLLCHAGWEDAVARALGEYLLQLEWDEFSIEGIVPGRMLDSVRSKAFPELTAHVFLRPSYYVDLQQLRQAGISFENSLSVNMREQLRRALRLYSRQGAVRVELAGDLPAAARFFEEMCRLHQARWTARSETGAFAPGRRLDFHRALIQRAFQSGAIHMLRTSAGEETIGILYNFVRGGKVYFFQSGFQYTAEKHLKPGIVTHARALQYYLDAGFADYDLLAGDAQYKRSLAKNCRDMAWVVFRRPKIKLAIIEMLRAGKRRVNGLVKKFA
jgi:CelD/BcsL family acetyltransferase involved in cellulose biosynthesis